MVIGDHTGIDFRLSLFTEILVLLESLYAWFSYCSNWLEFQNF